MDAPMLGKSCPAVYLTVERAMPASPGSGCVPSARAVLADKAFRLGHLGLHPQGGAQQVQNPNRNSHDRNTADPEQQPTPGKLVSHDPGHARSSFDTRYSVFLRSSASAVNSFRSFGCVSAPPRSLRRPRYNKSCPSSPYPKPSKKSAPDASWSWWTTRTARTKATSPLPPKR